MLKRGIREASGLYVIAIKKNRGNQSEFDMMEKSLRQKRIVNDVEICLEDSGF